MSYMAVELTVRVQLERQSGKFVSKDEAAEALIEEINSADSGELYIGDSVYTITDWEVQ